MEQDKGSVLAEQRRVATPLGATIHGVELQLRLLLIGEEQAQREALPE